MAILVTGGAGYIGSHVVLELLNQGEQVVILDDFSVGRKLAVPEGITNYMGDIADTRLVQRLVDAHDITAVMHMAAYTSIAGSVEEPQLAYATNTAKATLFLQAVVAAGVKQFVHSSTSAVYGNAERPREDAVLEPVSPYGHSQAMFERVLQDVADKAELSYTILRSFNVAGADHQLRIGQWSENPQHLIQIASQAAVGIRDIVPVHGDDYDTEDGTCIRDYTHVTEMALGHIAALRYLRAKGPNAILNLGSGKGYSVKQIIETAKRIGGRDFEVEYRARRGGDAPRIVADASLAKEKLGWVAQIGLDQIIESAINWEKRLLQLANSPEA